MPFKIIRVCPRLTSPAGQRLTAAPAHPELDQLHLTARIELGEVALDATLERTQRHARPVTHPPHITLACCPNSRCYLPRQIQCEGRTGDRQKSNTQYQSLRHHYVRFSPVAHTQIVRQSRPARSRPHANRLPISTQLGHFAITAVQLDKPDPAIAPFTE